MRELGDLAASAGLEVAGALRQRRAAPDPQTYVDSAFCDVAGRAGAFGARRGGENAGDGRLFVGAEEKDGGVVGLALGDAAVDALVCQGATPFGPSWAITESEGGALRRNPRRASRKERFHKWSRVRPEDR